MRLERRAEFTLALGARLAWLIGYRLAFVCVLTALAFSIPESLRGSSMGILGASSALASVIGAPFGSKIGEALGWRLGILAFGVISILGAVVFVVFYRRSPDSEKFKFRSIRSDRPHPEARRHTRFPRLGRWLFCWARVMQGASLHIFCTGSAQDELRNECSRSSLRHQYRLFV